MEVFRNFLFKNIKVMMIIVVILYEFIFRFV